MTSTEDTPKDVADNTLMLKLKRLATLHAEFLRLYAVEKLAILLSTLMVIFLLASIGLMCFFYITQCIVAMLSSVLGSEAASHGIVALAILLAGVVVFWVRRVVIVDPFTRFLTRLFNN